MTKAEMPEKRTLQSITEELVYPFGNLCGPSEVTIRENAVAYVLCRIPEQDYLKLKDGIDGFDWFVPYFECGGEIQPFFVNIYPRTSKKGKLRLKPYAKILYLSPMLEKRSFDIAVGVVAHELAHIILHHPIINLDKRTYDANEMEAWKRVEEWGFISQARKCQAVHKWRNSYGKYLIKKLMKEQN